MADLSPAAQVVLDLFSDRHELCGPFDDNWQELCLAAALRAVADRMIWLIGDICHPKYAEGIEAASDFVERIAAELEGK